MKATLTLEFDKLADLREAVQRLAPNTPQFGGAVNLQLLKPAAPVMPDAAPAAMTAADAVKNLTVASNPADPAAGIPAELPQATKPPRKPRADAGKPRGPYKTTTTGEPVAPEAVRAADSDAETAAAPATPTKSAAPAPAVAQAQEAQRPELPVPAAADPSKPPTLDDARAALSLISATKGMGMAACMQHLGAFGVIRITDLKPEHYPLFIRQAREKVAEAVKAGA